MDACRELLVTHDDGRRLCVDATCSSEPLAHDWRVDCDDLDEPCPACRPVRAERSDRQWRAA